MARFTCLVALALLLVAAAVEGKSSSPHRSCNTRTPLNSEKKFVNSQLETFHKKHRRSLEEEQQLTIKIKFHIIHDGQKGKVTREQCDQQIAQLNLAFSGGESQLGVDSKIAFSLDEVKYYDNAAWYSKCQKHESTFAEHGVDPTKYVNVFTCEGDGLLGWAYLPGNFPENYKQNLVCVAAGSLPQGDIQTYNKGDTLTHEIGHFFGLYHTFNQGGTPCTEGGDDGVSDTPFEASPGYECNMDRDTCPSDPGTDPLWSYMDYTDDDCMNRFSRGQVERMRDSLGLYKPILVSNSNGGGNPNPATTTAAPAPPTTTRTTTTTTTTTTSPESNICSEGCLEGWQGDGICDEACNVAACNFDSGDCDDLPEPLCNEGCYQGWSGDGFCDDACNVAACNFDEGDCAGHCSEGCLPGWSGDEICDTACFNEACNWDGGDCGEVEETTTNPNSGLSTKSCDELSWAVKTSLPVCGQSNKMDEAKSCFMSNTHAEAKEICESAGARLCTVEELEANVAKGTGCKLNSKYVWAADECTNPEQHMIAQGKKGNKSPTCQDATFTYGVRCCADVF